MTRKRNDLAVRVQGSFACFTRPEYAAERVSYPMISPSAAVGVLSSIFWKPEFDWIISEIWLLAEPEWVSMTKNEVSDRASLRSGPLVATESRIQRHNLFLRDVDYVIFARPLLRSHATEPEAKYRDQFRRRVERGSFYCPPYLGLREFVATFSPFDDGLRPVELTLPMGPMSLDLGYDADGKTTPEFFAATLVDGVLDVPLPSRFGSARAAG